MFPAFGFLLIQKDIIATRCLLCLVLVLPIQGPKLLSHAESLVPLAPRAGRVLSAKHQGLLGIFKNYDLLGPTAD